MHVYNKTSVDAYASATTRKYTYYKLWVVVLTLYIYSHSLCSSTRDRIIVVCWSHLIGCNTCVYSFISSMYVINLQAVGILFCEVTTLFRPLVGDSCWIGIPSLTVQSKVIVLFDIITVANISAWWCWYLNFFRWIYTLEIQHTLCYVKLYNILWHHRTIVVFRNTDSLQDPHILTRTSCFVINHD